MKKSLTLLFTVAVACALAMPVAASAKWFHKKKKDNATTTETSGKSHQKHAKKHGASKGMKAGQQGTNQ
jgi:ABC-type sugar transport system substrate-binding protein